MPPQLAWWATSLQLSGLSAEQAEIARQFLTRAMQLDPQVRDQMAYRIASDVFNRVAPPPPPRTPPPLALAAVLAERHRRELTRLRRFELPALLRDCGGEDGDVGDQQRDRNHGNHESPSALGSEE